MDMDGTIWLGRGMNAVGAHTLNNNNDSIGIACQGRFDDNDRVMPDVQFNSLIWLIKQCHAEYGSIPVIGHRDASPSACPGRFFPLEEVQRLAYRGDVSQSSERFPLSEMNILRMVELGVVQSPDFWRTVDSIQWLDELLANAGREGVLDRRVDNGIYDTDTAKDVLELAGIITTPEYWRGKVMSENFQYLGELIVNMANRCLDPMHRTVMSEAGGEDMKGQVLVANVVMNRHKSNMYPNGFFNVIMENGINSHGEHVFQFEPVKIGTYRTVEPREMSREAVQRALGGEDHSQGALFFNATRHRYTSWAGRYRVHAFDHGGHSFYL